MISKEETKYLSTEMFPSSFFVVHNSATGSQYYESVNQPIKQSAYRKYTKIPIPGSRMQNARQSWESISREFSFLI